MPQRVAPLLHFDLNESPIEYVHEFNFLGLTLDSSLSFKFHLITQRLRLLLGTQRLPLGTQRLPLGTQRLPLGTQRLPIPEERTWQTQSATPTSAS